MDKEIMAVVVPIVGANQTDMEAVEKNSTIVDTKANPSTD